MKSDPSRRARSRRDRVYCLFLPNGNRRMNEIEKLDNVTWYGHCVIHVMAALNDLPERG